MPRIILFIPMYNCEKQIVRVLAQLDVEIMSYVTEIIVVNNRSTDHGEEAVIAYGKEHPELPLTLLRNDENYGLGGSHKVAFQYAIEHHYDYLIVLHGDDQGNIHDLLPILQNKTYEQYDCCLGARFMKGSKLIGYSKFRTFGNRVYNTLFSLGTGKKIYDLGSGLNLYNVKILQEQFYHQYPDNLMFNYCMILGSAYKQHKTLFFPISWREDDQISNVKMVNQAIIVLKLLAEYILNQQKFIEAEHRKQSITHYQARIIATNKGVQT